MKALARDADAFAFPAAVRDARKDGTRGKNPEVETVPEDVPRRGGANLPEGQIKGIMEKWSAGGRAISF